MSDIVFARVDDRLIHGQVVFRWMDYVGAAELVIVDDELCKDTFIYRVFRSMLAPGRLADYKCAKRNTVASE